MCIPPVPGVEGNKVRVRVIGNDSETGGKLKLTLFLLYFICIHCIVCVFIGHPLFDVSLLDIPLLSRYSRFFRGWINSSRASAQVRVASKPGKPGEASRTPKWHTSSAYPTTSSSIFTRRRGRSFHRQNTKQN